MKYFIAVEIFVAGPIADLTSALQRAFNAGVAGDFQVLTTHAPSHMVVFSRDSDDDGEYVSRRADASGASIESAAMLQLATELEDGGVGFVAHPIVNALRESEAQCFDFGIGVFAAIAEMETASQAA